MPASNPRIVRLSQGAETRYAIEPLSVSRLGRDDRSAIPLSDPRVSRKHAMVQRDAADRCYLTDLGSRNGTTINGTRISAPVRLRDGDRIGIGDELLRFEDPVPPGASTRRLAKHVAVAETMLSIESVPVTALVIDIRNFCAIARRIGERRVSEMMSEIFGIAGELLGRHGCWSQKYLGDAIMGVWVHSHPRNLAHDLQPVVAALGELVELFEETQPRMALDEPVTFGAGVNCGDASIGNMGSDAAADFTALGDAVNKAFRLEAATRGIGRDLLIGADAIEGLPADAAHALAPRRVDVEFRGYDGPEPAYAFDFIDLGELGALLADAGVAELVRPAREPLES